MIWNPIRRAVRPIFGAVVLALGLGACATQVTQTGSYSPTGGTMPRPQRVLVSDFEVDPQAVQLDQGIGVFVPPSYATGLSFTTLKNCAMIDRRVAHLPGVRALSDHRLLVFRRR